MKDDMLKVMSFNIWFEPIDIVNRLNVLELWILHLRPDVVCLQEVSTVVYPELIRKFSPDYQFSYPEGIYGEYGCIILSKYPFIEKTIYPFTHTTMGRFLIVVKINVDGKDLIISTTHYESEHKIKTINKTKMLQYQDAFNILEDKYEGFKNVIHCADSNCLPHEEDFYFPGWDDAWVSKGDCRNKWTYDYYTNSYLRNLKKGHFRARLDRVVYRTVDFDIVGYQLLRKIKDTREASDHHGVLVTYELVA